MLMSLVKAKTPTSTSSSSSALAEKIQQRRYQILVHSLIYYECDTSIVSDAKWAEWGKELVQLQNEHPDIARTVIFAEAFKDFDASTGYHLPYRDEQIVNIAVRLLRQDSNEESLQALHRLQYEVPRVPAQYSKHKKPVSSNTTKRKERNKVEQKPRKGLFRMSGA